jgi:uncharacterized membrane protein
MVFTTVVFLAVFMVAWFAGVVVIPRLDRPAPALQPLGEVPWEPGASPFRPR